MKNLKKIVSYSLCTLLATCLFSCDGHDEFACYQRVKEEFPNAIKVSRPIGEKWEFIVIDEDSSIYFVETMNVSNTDLTQKELIHKW
jgi:hypothetical protein